MNNQFPISINSEGEDWSEFHRFATSIGSEREAKHDGKRDAVSSTTDNLVFEEFINKHKAPPYRGRGHMMRMLEFDDVTKMDYRTAQEMRSSGINMMDPDLAAIKKASLSAANSKVGSSQDELEKIEPRFLRASSSMSPESSGQFEDAESDVEPSDSQMPTFSSVPQVFAMGKQGLSSIPDPVPRSVFEGVYSVNDVRAIDQPDIDSFKQRFDESGFAKVDPASLADYPALPPCSSPLPDDQFLHDEIESKTDPKVQKVVQLCTSTPSEHQVAPDKPNQDLENFILSFKNKFSEHPEVLTCFLDVVNAWLAEEIAFLEMEESLTGILSEFFPDFLERFIQFTRDMEFPQVTCEIPLDECTYFADGVEALIS